MSKNYPVLPLLDVVVYPHMMVPLSVGRARSIKALSMAMLEEKQVILVAQKKATQDDPEAVDLYSVGTMAVILQLLNLADGTVRVLVEGQKRARIKNFSEHDACLMADVELVEERIEVEQQAEIELLGRSLLTQVEQYSKLSEKIAIEPFLGLVTSPEDLSRLVDTMSAQLALKMKNKQTLLEMFDLKQRIEQLMVYLENEISLLQIEKRIRLRIKQRTEEEHRRYYLQNKKEAIDKELAEITGEANDADSLAAQIEKAGMPKEAKEKALSELKKFKMMPPVSAEASVLRNYLDWMLQVPWKQRSKIGYDLEKAQKVLDADHYGLEKVKERIIEYLAVQKRVKVLKGPVLCLVGPPGVGKTSLGQSIANATGRRFIRIALGGVRDEAEIRGHRRTYVGSMPGRIIQKLTKEKVKNPLMMLDEVDKMAMDFRGDPASALLEVLDPEQNHAFADHYLEVDYDLSEVMFIATANSLQIPEALLDRMEIIRLAGYMESEKINIAMRYLLPRQMERNGIRSEEMHLSEPAVRDIIRYYTREAGVRDLERCIAKICRKVVKDLVYRSRTASNQALAVVKIGSPQLEKYLGVKKYRYGLAGAHDQIGRVTGLAWTSVGGELMVLEVSAVVGKGKLVYTGHLGEVMQESIQAAMTVVRERAESLGLEPDFYEKKDIHVHVPEGATPKDGPSAGIGMVTGIVSVLTRIPVRCDVAMTGEVTLRGDVLPIGGLKEKLIAAQRGGLKQVIIPEENRRDLAEIPSEILKHLLISPVKSVDEVFKIALTRLPGSAENPVIQN